MRGDNDRSRYSPGDVHQGGNGTQWGMPTYVVSSPTGFAYMRNTVIPECVAYAKANQNSTTATWEWGGFYWAAGDYTNSVGNATLTPNAKTHDCSAWGGVGTGIGFFSFSRPNSPGVGVAKARITLEPPVLVGILFRVAARRRRDNTSRAGSPPCHDGENRRNLIQRSLLPSRSGLRLILRRGR